MGQLGCITWHDVEPRIVRFRDPMGFQCHLVLGDERALLVDAMGGHGNLREAVSQVTDLPVTVVATHSHYDHVAGSRFFDAVYMHEAEVSRLGFERELAAAAHEKLVANGTFSPEEPFCLTDGSAPEIKLISEGDEFDLGGLTVKTVELPGHTVGSLGFLVPELGVLFSGDTCTPTMCLFFPESTDVQTYRETLAKMMTLDFEKFYTSHQDRTFHKSDLADFDACAEFVYTDPGSEWAHGLFPQFTGRIHMYRGLDPDQDDFLAIIEKDTPEAAERAKRIRAERRAARKARKAAASSSN